MLSRFGNGTHVFWVVRIILPERRGVGSVILLDNGGVTHVSFHKLTVTLLGPQEAADSNDAASANAERDSNP